LLQQAGEAGESILILQDDCDFLFAEIEGYRLPPSWDIFYGGYTADDPQDLEASDIVGAHFMGFSPAAATLACEYLLQLYHFPDFPADPRAARGEGFRSCHPPADRRRSGVVPPRPSRDEDRVRDAEPSALVAHRHRRPAMVRQAAGTARTGRGGPEVEALPFLPCAPRRQAKPPAPRAGDWLRRSADLLRLVYVQRIQESGRPGDESLMDQDGARPRLTHGAKFDPSPGIA
jgi:hypothetical protein